MKDTIGENRLIPNRLVFGVVPILSIIFTDLPEQEERLEAIAIAQLKMNVIVAERRVATALSKNLSQYADYIFRIARSSSSIF